MSSTVNGHEIRKRIKQDREYNDICRAIGRADQPPTRKELQLLTHRPRSQVHRLLRELRERGVVRRYRDPDDNRVYRYALVGGVE